MPAETSAVATGLEAARLLAARGEWGAALRAIAPLLEREPEDLGALLLKASVLLQSREETVALEHYQRAARLRPLSAEAVNGLARCLNTMGRNEEALASALSAQGLLAREENFAQVAPVYLTLVWIHRDRRRFKEALAVAEEGLSRCADAVLAQWASVVEEELEEAQQERC